ncbi:rRNA maturation RNase YbeY [Desulforhopalus singaporensis]|uniref:Endoribonuclease YbeY n=1 Tax=Desulforhopalus singaporensis TaxID=91360 RepID=A0A1H0PZU7_9BACT|nr:rRNA maturation RNase YbeY [Desulforhopalus singaporensis]SDP10584.1 probable rRNA maturation factor [Desulforhopalus singaporensis]
MPAEITVIADISSYPIDLRDITDSADVVLAQCGSDSYNLSVVLADDREIQRLNRQYRHQDKPTNVLSFPFSDGADDVIAALPVRELGDVVISVETASREALEYGQSLYYRMRWLLVHGILHLMGYDHERSEDDEHEMFAKEKKLLKILEKKEERSDG